ncbi:hypothetical protein [Pseudomonas putida]|uniref:hypothetical protein n=1 Tax=Pseudomonas putida TaxID=303 RepID=UPI000750CD8A|nr:hypothetical protein [Pseudomonas putida]
MRFRDKGNMIQCIRTTYDSDKGRGVDKLIGSLPGDSEWVPAELQALLTEEEAKDLSGVLFDRMLERSSALRRESLLKLAGTVKLAREALKSQQNVELMGDKATALLWAELDELRRDLRAAGLPKPKPAADVTM